MFCGCPIFRPADRISIKGVCSGMKSCSLKRIIDDMSSFDWLPTPINCESVSLGEILKLGMVAIMHCDDPTGEYCTQKEHLNGSQVEVRSDEGLQLFIMGYMSSKPFTVRLDKRKTSIEHPTIQMQDWNQSNQQMELVIKYTMIHTMTGLNFIALNIDDNLRTIWLPSAIVKNVDVNEIHVCGVKDIFVCAEVMV